jgi:hypothetical protein
VADAVAFRGSARAPAAGEARGGGNGEFVSGESVAFASSTDALSQLERAQRAYTMAATYLATHDTSTALNAAEQYRTRLATLDRIAEAIQPALRDAPQDAVLNQYYLATLGAREQTLRRLGTALAVGNRLTKF